MSELSIIKGGQFIRVVRCERTTPHSREELDCLCDLIGELGYVEKDSDVDIQRQEVRAQFVVGEHPYDTSMSLTLPLKCLALEPEDK